MEPSWTIPPLLYRWSRGRVGSRLAGMPVLLPTPRGRRTGSERTSREVPVVVRERR